MSMGEDLLKSLDNKAAAATSAGDSGSVLDWLGDNVLHPAVNSGIIEPYNAIANTANFVTRKAIDAEVLNKSELLAVPESKFLSPTWFVQGVSGGLAMLVPYGLAGKAAGGSLRKFGQVARAEGSVARFLKNEQAAQIIGAAAYDGLRVPRPGETHLGNALGGATAFFIFEKGNAFSKTLGTGQRIQARLLTGMLGASAQHSVAHLVSSGHLPQYEQLVQAGVAGAAMNLALPATQNALSSAADGISHRLGRGIPIDRYLETRYGADNPILRSHQLGLLVDQSPWVRVQDGAARTSYTHGRRRVELSAGETSASKLGHELEHHLHAQRRDGQLELDAAEAVLKDPRIDPAQKTQQAWEIFRGLRLNQELRAQLSEGVIAWELGQAQRPPEVKALAGELPNREVAPGVTYETIWRSEFDRFAASGGKSRPQLDFARSGLADPQIWQGRLSNWSALSQQEKLTALSQLKHAPDGVSQRLWERSMSDPDSRIKIEAAQQISALPQTRMLSAWMKAIHCDDYFVRLTALSKIGELPANERMTAWTHALSHRPALMMPTKPEPGHQGRPERYIEGHWPRPPVPDWATEPLKQLGEQTPTSLAVKAIESFPSNERLGSWLKALNDSRTSRAAAQNLEVVPARDRLQAWNAAWKRHGNDTYRRNWNAEPLADAVVKQIPRLQGGERLEAWKTAIGSKSDLRGEALNEALASLPVEIRLGEWTAALETVKPKPPEPAETQTDRFGYSWRPLRPAWVPDPPRRELARAIEALPEESRTQAWLEVAALGTKGRESDLTNSIRHLPAEDRLGAFQMAMEKFPTGDIRWATDAIPPHQLKDVVKTILSAPEGEVRQGIVQEFPIWAPKDLPLDKRQEIVREAFEHAGEHASPKDFLEIRKWWAELPEPFDENSTLPVQPTPVRDYLSATLEPRLLGRLMLNGNDWPVADQLAITRPEVLRTLAQRSEWLGDESSAAQLAPVVAEWLGTGSLEATVRKALAVVEPPTDKYDAPNLTPHVVEVLAGSVDASSRQAALSALRESVLADSPSPAPHVTNLALAMATQLGKADPAGFRAHFLEPVESALQDPTRDYSWRLTTGREIASLARSGEMGDVNIKLPNLRMPPQVILSEAEQTALRSQTESALMDNSALGKLMGEGPLGRLFPSVFGDASEGGMVGRQQHGGHQFPLHVHTLHVLNRVRQHPDFNTLSPKDQTNVLWAALLHDSGKQAGKSDPDHEWVSANLSWGVLRTLGYPPQRAQRIADLISRHGEMSFDPQQRTSQKLADESYTKSLAVFYRHPSAVKQLRILNEADIKSIDATSSYWTPDVRAELDAITRTVGAESHKLTYGTIPLLTTRLPDRFGLVQMKGDYAVLAHASTHMENAFLEQLSLIESPEYSVSASLLTPRHHRLYYQDANVVALVAGPPEHISQADRSNLGTGRAVDWKGHVELATSWIDRHRGKEFLTELDTRIRKLAQGSSGGGGLKSLPELWRRLAQFDTLDELAAGKGVDSPYYKGQLEIFRALTTDAGGKPSKEHNEIKLNNPTLVGLGILRRSRPVFLDQFHGSEQMAALLGGQPQPRWLIAADTPPQGAVIVPSAVWKAAMRRRLPLVVLDP